MSTNDSELFDRAYGCFLGQAIGDALGTRYEFMKSTTVKSKIDADRRRTDGFLAILGGGPFSMECGQVTDDTEMAMALARSLRRAKRYDSGDVARSYAAWFRSAPPDIGITTQNTFDGLDKATVGDLTKLSDREILDSMRRSSEAKNQGSMSNGCLMRISPLVIAGSRWSAEKLRETATEDCRLTHPNPIAHDAVRVYVTAVKTLIETGDRERACAEAVEIAQTDVIKELLTTIDDGDWRIPIRINIATDRQPKLKYINGDAEHQGYLGVALNWTFAQLRRSNEQENFFERALIDVIARGGDTDTNGCIAGALIGAYVGASKIPDEWKTTVLGAAPRRLGQYDWVSMADAKELVADLLETKDD